MELLAVETGIFTGTLAAGTAIIGALLGLIGGLWKRNGNGNGNGSRLLADIHEEVKESTKAMIRVEVILDERLPRGGGT